MAREIVLDTETTGFEPHLGHRLVELACLEIEDYLPTGRSFHVYIDPERDMPPEAEKVHGLSAAFLKGKPKFADKEIHRDFLDFVGDSPIIAHNAGFDRAFVNYELQTLGVAQIPEERWIDTLAIARKKFPGMHNSLDALCKRFKISLSDREKHGALIDARLLAGVYLELKGGRALTLELTTHEMAAQAVAIARAGSYGARPRPLPFRSTDAERELHAQFIRDVMKNETLWGKFGI
ncbi:MAG: DNA polymerase III subunit epsilon [Pseudomonadota bacterium]|uniref:DNA polymerase III subunit epsilon n=1 Tax=unclassified Phenylobacterium TaxID=2640670 RepID=UPI0006F6CFEC|nr:MULTISPECIES: DNA polymerase III subunit epsilon [unclassified Phenylobacterium]KRB48574.1 DNA polymerase III subunit epsilon [Phenylobacterium sp. Root700]MBT9473527.1 DNA polymerase III subunit epsilon [Phenylobacterium sp.]